MKNLMSVLSYDQVKSKIIEIRKQKVILDSDVAVLYGVETKRINEAVKNNPAKFPDGYLLDLDANEWLLLKSKISTSIKGGKVKTPTAFTERGLYMLATILKSPRAIATTIAILDIPFTTEFLAQLSFPRTRESRECFNW